MISFSDIFYRYPGKEHGWDVEGITLEIREGEFVLICGRSGSGKTTLSYLFNGLIPHFFGGTLKGIARVDGMDTSEVSVARLLPRVGMVLQNTDAHLFSSTVEDEIAFGLESLGLPSTEIETRIRETAEILRIEDLLHRSPLALSGGERRLAAIGSVLCMNPPLLLLDEPFAHLDWAGITRVRDILADLHRSGKTIVLIEHRVSGLLPLASRCIFMEQGKIVSDCTPSDAVSVMNDRHLVPRYPDRPREVRGKTPVISIDHLSHEREGRRILSDISFQVTEGEAVAIVGRNGSGKTTLIRHLNGLRRPSEGRVSIMGSALQGKSPMEIASQVGISFQNPNDQFFKTSVRGELAAGLKGSGRGDEGAAEICDLFGLQDLLERSPYRLSEGEKRRVAIASVAVMNPRILVVDEPTVGQDGRFLELLAHLIASLRNRGHTIVIVTHDLEFALASSDRWIVLHEGRKVGDGTPEELLRDEKLIALGALGTEAGWTSQKNPPFPPLQRGATSMRQRIPPLFEKGDGPSSVAVLLRRVEGGFDGSVNPKGKKSRSLSLDPRTKMILGAMAIALVLFTRTPEVHCIETLLLFAALWRLKMLEQWVRSLRLMGPMIVLVFVISLLSMDFETSLFLSLRLFNLFTVSFVFFRTMKPEEMGDGMRKLGLPYELSFILTTSMRYVPLVGRRIRLITEAQMSRGIDLRPRLRNAPNFMALLMPLLVQSFLLSEELAMAMEARGFGLQGRSFRKSYRITPKEYVLMLLSLALMTAFFWWEIG